MLLYFVSSGVVDMSFSGNSAKRKVSVIIPFVLTIFVASIFIAAGKLP